MPKEGSYISFNRHYNKVRHPFVIYADFESLAEPIDTNLILRIDTLVDINITDL